MNDRLMSIIADEVFSYKGNQKGSKLLKFTTTRSANTFQNYQNTRFNCYFSNYIIYILLCSVFFGFDFAWNFITILTKQTEKRK